MVKNTMAVHGSDPTMPCKTITRNVCTFITDFMAVQDSSQTDAALALSFSINTSLEQKGSQVTLNDGLYKYILMKSSVQSFNFPGKQKVCEYIELPKTESSIINTKKRRFHYLSQPSPLLLVVIVVFLGSITNEKTKNPIVALNVAIIMKAQRHPGMPQYC